MTTLKFKSVSVGMQKDNRHFNTPAIILELSGCNLRCMYGKHICRSAFQQDEDNINIHQAAKFIRHHSTVNHIVIKGGEPLLYKKELENFLDDVWKDDMVITIYTNGTMPILNPLGNKYRISLYIVNLLEHECATPGTVVTNGSGKEITLGTSDIEQVKAYYNNRMHTLQNLCMYSNDYLLCIKPSESLAEQVESLTEKISDSEYDFVKNYFVVHPIQEHIVLISEYKNETENTVKLCKKNGYKFNTLQNL